MKKIIYFLLLVFCFSTYQVDAKSSSFLVSGVGRKVRINVEKRLTALQQTKSLAEIKSQEVQNQVIKAIQPFGFFKAQVKVRKVANSTFTILIRPGPQVRISTLQVEIIGAGAHNDSLVSIIKKFPLQIGDPLLIKPYNKAKQNLINTAENLGYLHNTFQKAEIVIDEQQNSAQISLLFDTGPLFYFGHVYFDSTNINPDLLRRFVPFKYHHPYSTDQILKLNNDLSNSGYFSSVIVKPKISESTIVPIKVHLSPAPKYSYSFGAGYGTDTGFRGRAGLSIIPVNRRGHKFSALALGSQTQSAVQAQYSIPGRNPVNDQYTFTGNYSNLNYDIGSGNAYLLTFADQHNTEQFKRILSLNSLYESSRYTNQAKTKQFLLYPKASFGLIKTTNPLFSPSGYNLSFEALGASKEVLSDLNFGQLTINAKAAYMIEAVRLRIYGHTIQGFTATADIYKFPVSLAFALGGTENFKAAGYKSIGPGKILTYAGLELQKEVKKNWYIVGFTDVGDVYNPTPRKLHYDVGAGLMWVSPFGPIKVGVAQAIDTHLERTTPRPRLIINVGSDL